MYLQGYLFVLSFILSICLGFSIDIEQNEENETTTATVPQGILMTGSDWNTLDNDNIAEIYVPELQKSCSLSKRTLLMQRSGHTQAGALSCGGYYQNRSHNGG